MRLELYPNLTGMAGTERTIVNMRRLVESGKQDPKVVLQAHKIVRKIDRNNWYGMADAIFRFVHDKIAYIRDPIGVEFVKSPAITLETKTGDCDDQAVLFSALAESVGIKSRFKTVKADPRYPAEFSHVYSQVQIPKKGWVTGDTIVPRAKFGWEAKDFAAKTWPGVSGIESASFIKGAQAGIFGGIQLAAGSVGSDDETEEEMDTTFGNAFADAGGMWDNEPLLADNAESIDTVIDAKNDFWGGATDTDPGPGFKSRMLPPGAGAMNGIRLERNEHGELGYYDAMGGWRPFKKLKKRIKAIQKKVKAVVKKVEKKLVPAPLRKINEAIRGTVAKAKKTVQQNINTLKKDIGKVAENISQSAQKLGKQIGVGIGLSTPETRKKFGKAAVQAIVVPLWTSPAVQTTLEMDRRIQDFIAAQRQGRMPGYAMGPPSGMQGLAFAGNIGRMRGAAAANVATASMGAVSAAIAAVASVAKATGSKQDASAAQKAVDKYTKGLAVRLNKAIEDSTKAFVAAGGMAPVEGATAPAEWVNAFIKQARAGANAENTGWEYFDLMKLITDLEASVVPLGAAKKVMGVAYNAYNKAQGPQTLQVAQGMVEKAAQSGAISPAEVAEALKITNLVAQGYSLTPQQQALAARIASGARGGKSKAWMVAIPAAVAAGAALLI